MEEDDFGFSFATEEDMKSNDDRADKLRKMIMPLLNNLKKNPEKEMIVWPDRVKKIDDFIKKMNKVVDG